MKLDGPEPTPFIVLIYSVLFGIYSTKYIKCHDPSSPPALIFLFSHYSTCFATDDRFQPTMLPLFIALTLNAIGSVRCASISSPVIDLGYTK